MVNKQYQSISDSQVLQAATKFIWKKMTHKK